MPMSKIRLAGLVLAAGRGTRFAASSGADAPRSKMLAHWQGKALVSHVVQTALAAELDPVVVVTGHAAGDVEAEIADAPFHIVHNPDFEVGLASSLKVGAAALPEDVEGVVVLLGDMPRITAKLVAALRDAFAVNPHVDAVVPVHDERRGNPVLLAKKLFPRLSSLSGDRGASQILKLPGLDILELVTSDDAVSFDVDTADALVIK